MTLLILSIVLWVKVIYIKLSIVHNTQCISIYSSYVKVI